VPEQAILESGFRGIARLPENRVQLLAGGDLSRLGAEITGRL
jgi:hypothetical protein